MRPRAATATATRGPNLVEQPPRTVTPPSTQLCNGLDDNCNDEMSQGLPTLNVFADADGEVGAELTPRYRWA